MTIENAKHRLVSWVYDQVGYREGADNWNRYAEAMDRIDGLTWGKKQNQPWCGMFKLAAFVESFGADLALRMLYSPRPTAIPLCSAGAQYFKNHGAWYDRPQVGDVVFFNVSGGINHEGVVTAVGMGAFTTVEGNSSDMVARRTYSIGAPNIAGFGRPNWALVVSLAEPAANADAENAAADSAGESVTAELKLNTAAVLLPLLRRGDAGEAVRAAQLLLIGRGCGCGPCGADGEFGGGTYAGVIQFQRQRGLDIDGVIGPITWAALLGV